jgi:hypothetical protein
MGDYRERAQDKKKKKKIIDLRFGVPFKKKIRRNKKRCK